jgi:ferritin
MGMRSSFQHEEIISFHDNELYEYCKTRPDNSTAQEIVLWYEEHRKPEQKLQEDLDDYTSRRVAKVI